MHLILLLLIQVHAEWVEIFQQHYKKPLRPSYMYTALEKPGLERTTQGHRIYINNSLPEYNWSKAVHNDDIRNNQYETSSASVISKHEIIDRIPTRIIDVEDVETKKKGNKKVPKPVIVQSTKTADFINHEVPKISNTVIVQRLKPTEATVNPMEYDDFEIKPLEVYNLSDVELITEESAATVINNRNVHGSLTPSAATIFKTASEHSLISKIPNQEFTKVTEQELFEDDWPINEDRYEYVVQIVPSNSNKRRVDIVRNNVNTNVPKATNDKIFESDKPTSTWTLKTKHKLKNSAEMSSFEKIVFERDTTTAPKVQSSSKRQKSTTKTSTTTIPPEPEIETVAFEGNNERTKLIHLSTNINPKLKLKVNNNKNESNSSVSTTDPDKVMIQEILKDQVMSSEITSQKAFQSNTGIIKKVYPTKIVEVDKTGHEIDGTVKLLPPTKGTIAKDELTVNDINKENQYEKFNKIPYQTNIKQTSVTVQKRFNKTKEIKKEISHSIATQTRQDLEAVTISENHDQIYKIPIKDIFKPIPKVTTKVTPALTTAKTTYSINIFDRDTGTADSGSYERYITLQHKIPEFITKEEHFNRDEVFGNSNVKDNVNIDINVRKKNFDTNVTHMDTNNVETNFKNSRAEVLTENSSTAKNDDKQGNFDTVAEDRKQETLSSANKPSTMDTLMKILKIVTDTIRRNTRKNVNSKVRYLEDLRDTISRSISK